MCIGEVIGDLRCCENKGRDANIRREEQVLPDVEEVSERGLSGREAS